MNDTKAFSSFETSKFYLKRHYPPSRIPHNQEAQASSSSLHRNRSSESTLRKHRTRVYEIAWAGY